MYIPNGIAGKKEGASINHVREALEAELRSYLRNVPIGNRVIQRDSAATEPAFSLTMTPFEITHHRVLPLDHTEAGHLLDNLTARHQRQRAGCD